jgi:asparagine synthase (glutamine-hydrolysing)
MEAIAHRGPDDSGEWWSDNSQVGFGFRRLAIIDLSPGGHQPMWDTARERCIIFNGEIYNYRELKAELCAKGHNFKSESDTEVILEAYREWGIDCVSRLNGMYAFALFDSQRNHVVMARDRAGEKPLFYRIANGEMRFASERKALMADPEFPRRVDPQALDCYLAMGFVPDERTILNGVKKLPPAHLLVFDLGTGTGRVSRYWSAPPLEPSANSADEEELLNELDALLADAVSRQSHADVPVGILLSGGVDSSLVTAMAARSSRDVHTFTIRFPDNPGYDETEHARLVATHFGTRHLELEADKTTVDLLPVLAHQYDEPIVDSSMVPTYLVSRLVREHCTVALGGDGGDELFGGYHHYNRLLWAQSRTAGVPRPMLQAVGSAAGSMLPTGFKGRIWLQALGADFRDGLPLIASYFDEGLRHELLGSRSNDRLSAEKIRESLIPSDPDLLQRATRMDFQNYLVEDILVKVDRASMLNSLEVRAPLLDYRIIEFAFGRVPSRLKATATSRKILLKTLARKLLPPGFDLVRKQGFSIPIKDWLKGGEWKDFFHDVLLSSENTTFNKKVVERLLDGQRKGRNNSERLFALVMFELWRRDYSVSV